MEKVSRFIIKGRYVFALIIVALVVMSFFTMPLVKIEQSVAAYLPDDTNTKRALKIMDEEFTTYGSTTIMIKNISSEEIGKVTTQIAKMDGVKSVDFDANSKEHFKDNNALFSVTFAGGVEDEVSVNAYDNVVKYLEPYDLYIPSPLTTNFAEQLAKDVKMVLGLCAVIILIILLLTSNSYAEVIVFPVVFIVAALLNMGSNYWFGTISFVSNTVCVILQLALAIDYSIILCHRFTDEKLTHSNPKEAMVVALSKAIPEILSSCLTTISGLLALVTMQLKLGQDLGLVLAKSILCSILVVIVFMPTLLLWVSKLMDKTAHKSFVPKFKTWTRGVLKTRKVLPVIFLVFVAVFGILTLKIDYSYALDCIDTNKPTDVMVAIDKREEVFGNDNLLVVLVPKQEGYTNEKEIIDTIKAHDKINSVLGISDIEIKGIHLVDKVASEDVANKIGIKKKYVDVLFDKYYAERGIAKGSKVEILDFADFALVKLRDKGMALPPYVSEGEMVTAKELSSDFGIDELYANILFSQYFEDYHIDKNAVGGKAPLSGILDYALYMLNNDEGIRDILLDKIGITDADIDGVYGLLSDAKEQLIGTNYTRVLVKIDYPQEGEEVFNFATSLESELKEIDDGIIFAGETMSAYDLSKSFETDTFIISILTGVFVYIILLFTFKSWGLPIALVAVIQGAILINFGVIPLFGKNFFFFVYLIVSAIQMGATIDYAIIVTNHYREERKIKPKDVAIYDAMSASFPAIITSGTIMVVAPLFVGIFISDPLISSLGYCLARGSFISILSVLTVLPQLLYTFERAFLKTTFRYSKKGKKLTFAPSWTTIDNSIDTAPQQLFKEYEVANTQSSQDKMPDGDDDVDSHCTDNQCEDEKAKVAPCTSNDDTDDVSLDTKEH